MNMLTSLVALLLMASFDSSCEEKSVRQLLNRSETVIVADVVQVISPPLPIWTSGIITTQMVKYKVIKVLKGNLPESEIVTLHRLIPGSRTSNKDKSKPQLSPRFFKRGRSLLLILNKEDWPTQTVKGTESKAYYVVAHETCGVFPLPSASAQAVEKIIAEK